VPLSYDTLAGIATRRLERDVVVMPQQQTEWEQELEPQARLTDQSAQNNLVLSLVLLLSLK